MKNVRLGVMRVVSSSTIRLTNTFDPVTEFGAEQGNDFSLSRSESHGKPEAEADMIMKISVPGCQHRGAIVLCIVVVLWLKTWASHSHYSPLYRVSFVMTEPYGIRPKGSGMKLV